MPRYYFDIDDGRRFTRDEEGLECPSRKAVRDFAMGALPDIARDELPEEDRRDFVVKVRDESGRYVFQAILSLASEWLNQRREDRRA
jgi:hypothetical protein